MSAPHFFVDSLSEGVVRIGGDEARHAARALRIRPGETITVSDGKGSVATCIVRRVGDAGERVVEATVQARASVPDQRPRVIVFPAVPKAGKLEPVVQKLTEIGVAEIRPWFAARSVVRWDRRKAIAHGERLRAVAVEAAKQSRRPWLPVVGDPQVLGEIPPATVVLHEEEAVRLSMALPDHPPAEIGVVIGPEGGLDGAEVAALIGRGARAAGLGPAVLRTETAAVIGPALVMARYGLLG